MSDGFETPELFTDLARGKEQVTPRKPVPRKKAPGERNAKQLRMFTEAPGSDRDGFDLDLEPLDATFRDSSEAPLHSWFPYLEGYSPRFVERVWHEYLRDAKRVLEPFAGSGTTPIVLTQAGIECAYSEANPAMVFIAGTKLAVLRLDAKARAVLARSLTSLAGKLTQHVAVASTDESLRAGRRVEIRWCPVALLAVA